MTETTHTPEQGRFIIATLQNAPGIFDSRGGHTVQPVVISSSIS